MVGPMVARQSARRYCSPHGRVELEALTVNRARSLECDVLRVDGKEQGPISIDQCGIPTQGNGIDGVVLLAIGAPE